MGITILILSLNIVESVFMGCASVLYVLSYTLVQIWGGFVWWKRCSSALQSASHGTQLLFIWEGRRWEYVLLWFCSLYTSGMWKLGKFLTGKDTGQCWKVLPLQIPITIENIYRGNWFREIVLRPKMLIYIPYTDFIPSDFAHGCIAHRNAWMCKRIKKKKYSRQRQKCVINKWGLPSSMPAHN